MRDVAWHPFPMTAKPNRLPLRLPQRCGRRGDGPVRGRSVRPGPAQALAVGGAVQAEDVAGKVQVLLNRPDGLVLVGRQDSGWVADCDPADRHHRVSRQDGAQVHDCVDADLGARADACAVAVVERLQGKGYPALAPANPLRGLTTDSAYIASVLKSVKGPIVLVGHSYGGAVITNAAVGNPNVKALVYIAAFVPDKGEKLGELINKYPGSEIQAAVNPVPYPNPDGTTGTDLYLKPDKFRSAFTADRPASTTRVMQVTQRSFSASSFEQTTQDAAWHTIPSWGLVAGADKAIPPALERFEYKRAGSTVVEVPGASHVA